VFENKPTATGIRHGHLPATAPRWDSDHRRETPAPLTIAGVSHQRGVTPPG
jgi:hypothetical protein